MRLLPRDILIFDTIQRHGPLPHHYLFALTKSKDNDGFRKRLLALTRNGYLVRVDELSDPFCFWYFKVYNLDEKAEKILGGKRYLYAPAIKGGNEHALMTAYITANIELEADKRGYRYITQEEILAKAPVKDLLLPSTIQHTLKGKNARSNRPTEPDQIFGIEYAPGNARFFALETDRGTEPETRDNLNQNSILRKLLCYKDILEKRAYREHWNLPHLFPLFITTSKTRAHNMREQLGKLGSNKFFLFNSMEGFDPYFFPPKRFYPELFGEYERTGAPFHLNNPAVQ